MQTSPGQRPRRQIRRAAGGEPILVDRGEDPSVLVIVFTGLGGGLGMGPYDFMALTGALAYSRLLVRDPFRVWYQRGLDDHVSSLHDLAGLLQSHVRALAPETTITIGNSSGGYAALLMGHLIAADYVHALAPQTYLDLPNILRYRDVALVRGHWRDLLRMHRGRRPRPVFLDLRPVLSEDNGKTRYFVHVCADHERDRQRAEHLTGVPRLCILQYPGDHHQVVGVMARHRFLRHILQPEGQDRLDALHRKHFGAAGAEGPPASAEQTRREAIVDIILQTALREVDRGEVDASADLTGELGLDSVAWLAIVLGLENAFRIRIDQALLSDEDLRSVDALESLVLRSPRR